MLNIRFPVLPFSHDHDERCSDCQRLPDNCSCQLPEGFNPDSPFPYRLNDDGGDPDAGAIELATRPVPVWQSSPPRRILAGRKAVA